MKNSALIEILERPVRNCEMVHEDVIRDKDTLLPISIDFAQQCNPAGQHLGCYHWLLEVLHGNKSREASGYWSGTLGQILSINNSYKILHLLEIQYRILKKLDDNFRECRIGPVPGPSSLEEVPSLEKADKDKIPLVAQHKTIMIILEILRPKILKIVRASVSATA